NGEDGASPKASRTFVVRVEPVNDPPSVTGPTIFNATEGKISVVRGVSVSDVDAQEDPGAVVEVTVSAGLPTSVVRLRKTLGLWVMTPSTSSSVTFRGGLSHVNTALMDLTYQGGDGFFGTDKLVISVNDLGNTGEGGPLLAHHTISIWVSAFNNPPQVIIAAAGNRGGGEVVQGVEDEPVPLRGLSIEDPEAGDELMLLKVAAIHGRVSILTEGRLEFVRGTGTMDVEM
ncbi:unnamed protein product, partial [Discosporangium mesarthrocarpum]